MNGRYTIERSRRPMGIAARGGQWLLPWVSVLVASATIAYAAEQALVGSSGWARPAQEDGRAPPVASASTSRSTVVNLSSVDGDGKRMSVVCLTTPDRVSADDLAINPEDMATVVANLCKPDARLSTATTRLADGDDVRARLLTSLPGGAFDAPSVPRSSNAWAGIR